MKKNEDNMEPKSERAESKSEQLDATESELLASEELSESELSELSGGPSIGWTVTSHLSSAL